MINLEAFHDDEFNLENMAVLCRRDSASSNTWRYASSFVVRKGKLVFHTTGDVSKAKLLINFKKLPIYLIGLGYELVPYTRILDEIMIRDIMTL